MRSISEERSAFRGNLVLDALVSRSRLHHVGPAHYRPRIKNLDFDYGASKALKNVNLMLRQHRFHVQGADVHIHRANVTAPKDKQAQT